MFLSVRGYIILTTFKSINDITKEYNSMFKVIKYHNPLLIRSNYDRVLKKRKLSSSEDSVSRSIRRTKSIIQDYCLTNNFDYFITFTFNPKKVDRYDKDLCFMKMQGWLSRVSSDSRSSNADFKYLIVPEYHKDGAIHFHALFAGYPKAYKKTNVIQGSKLVYNLPSFRFGFTNAKRLDDPSKVYGYLTKYITKDMITVKGKKRYWTSKNLLLPPVYHNSIDYLSLSHRLSDDNLAYTNKYASIYKIPKFD